LVTSHASCLTIFRNNQVLDAVDLETAPWERQTTGTWIDLPKEILNLLLSRDVNAAEAIHAAQHAFLHQFPMASDLRTECKPVR
jgi:DEAD/DEAH box helicase domain-containing protein